MSPLPKLNTRIWNPTAIAAAATLAACICFLPVLTLLVEPTIAETRALMFNGAIEDGSFQKIVYIKQETIVKEVRLTCDDDQDAEGETAQLIVGVFASTSPGGTESTFLLLDTEPLDGGSSGVRYAPANAPLLFKEDRLILGGEGLTANTYSLQVVLAN